MKYLSSNGREESRTNKGRTSKLTFAYILAAFFLSFGLMFAGSVTSYATAGGDELNNTNNNEQNNQNLNNTNNDQNNQNLNNTNNDQNNQNQNNTNNNDQSNQNLNNTNNDQNNQNQNNTNNNNQNNTNNNEQNNQNQNNVNNNNQSNENQNNINNNDQNNVQQPAPAPKITFAWDNTVESGATVSDGTEGTGRLAGYSTTVNHYTNDTGDDITSILIHTTDDSNFALKEEDFNFDGLGEGYTVQYDLAHGIINVVKTKTVSDTPATPATTDTPAQTNTSSTKTTVYYQFTEITKLEDIKESTGLKDEQGNQIQYEYYFVPYTYDQLNEQSAIIGVPEGTAKLYTDRNNKPTGTGARTGTGDYSDYKTFGSTNSHASSQLSTNGVTLATTGEGENQTVLPIKNNVYVDVSGKNFDNCRTGILYPISGVTASESNYYQLALDNGGYVEVNGLWGFWCGYGGAQAFSYDKIFGRVYTFKTAEVTDESLKAKAKEGAFDNVGLEGLKLTDKDIAKYLDVTLDINEGENPYHVGGCTVVDGELNYLKNKDTISIKFGNTTKEIKVDLSSLGKQVWERDHKGMREATSVSGNDIAALQRAIAEGLANELVGANNKDMQALSEKLAAAIWQQNNQAALALDEDDPFNYDEITKASAKYAQVKDGVKQYMNTNSKGISDRQKLVEKKVNDEADKFMAARLKDAKTNPSDEDTNPYADATADNTDKILASKGDYDKLAPAIKRFIDEKYTTANTGTENAALTYAEIYERALNIKTTADDFVEKYASILVKKDNEEDPDQRETYNRTNTSNYAQIISGANAWKNLTEEERKYINKALNLGNGEAGAEGGVLTNEITFEKLLADAYALRELLNRPAYVAYEDTYDGPEEVYPVFLPKKEVKKEAPVVVETKTEHNTKKHSTENGSSKKTTDDPKLRKENDNALEKIFNNLTKKENEKTDVLAMLEKTVSQIASSITETAKATFGNGAILINVQSWLANTESGEGMWTNSSARNKNLAANESQVSYTLENADRLAASVLTASELNYVNNGDTMEIRLRINPNEEKVSQEHKNQFDDAMVAVQDSFVGLTKGEYLDISLEKRRNNGAWQYIPETEDAVRIAIDVPANLVQSGRTFFIIRNHDGECTILRDLDDNDETLTIETDRFSDYLVIYDDNFAESAKNAASGTLYGSAAGTTPTYNTGNTNVVMYVVTFLAILFMVIVVISMRRRDEER